MRVLLAILAVLSFLIGAALFVVSKSAVHEIEAFVVLLISAVFLVGAAIVEAVQNLRSDLAAARSGELPK
jgi:hypothetical protein